MIAEKLLTPFFSGLKPPRARTFRQFAEEELVLAQGPRRGLRFDTAFMPFTRLVLDEFDRGYYRRFFLSGAVQTGKTVLSFILPVMYHLFELGEDVIIGVPDVSLAQSIYDDRIKPSIVISRYHDLIPSKGSGSRGGKFLSITFLNGAKLRFMGAGGGDAQRSSHSARVVVLTEIDKMDKPGKASREADPITQIEARTKAFGDRALVYAECTMSIEKGRIHREVTEFGTDSRPYFRCVHCSRPVALERESFHGWQGVDDLLAARAKATFACPNCGKYWTELDRAAALAHPVLVSKNQTIDEGGQVVGSPPPTNTFGFRWTALASPLVSMADVAEQEFRGERSGNQSDQKALDQFVWARPHKDDLVDLSGITRELVLSKIVQHGRGEIPDTVVKTTLAIDLGLYRCWWILVGWRRDGSGHVIDYGVIEVHQERQPNPVNILTALKGFREDTIKAGWGPTKRQPDMVLVDSGYRPDVAYTFVLESGQPRYLASKGMGTGRDQENWRSPRPSSDPNKQVGNEWVVVVQPTGIKLVELHADYWKGAVHDGFAAASGSPGSLSIFHARAWDHVGFARQITAERLEQEFVAGKGQRTFWNRLMKDNHYLDVTAYARAAADILGIKMIKIPGAAPVKRPQAPAPPIGGGSHGIRTKY